MADQRRRRSNAERQAAYRRRMNQVRERQLSERSLPPLPAIPSIPGDARWKMAIRHARSLMETTLTEMQEYYEERTQAWQESERGEMFEDRLQAIEELLSSMGEIAMP